MLIAILLFGMVYSWYLLLSEGGAAHVHVNEEAALKHQTQKYLKAWSTRAPIDSMKSFFIPSACTYDLIEGCEECELDGIRRQLRWRAQPLGRRKQLLTVIDEVYSPQQAVIRAQLLPHRWYEQRVETAKDLIIWLKFDTTLLIREQYIMQHLH